MRHNSLCQAHTSDVKACAKRDSRIPTFDSPDDHLRTAAADVEHGDVGWSFDSQSTDGSPKGKKRLFVAPQNTRLYTEQAADAVTDFLSAQRIAHGARPYNRYSLYVQLTYESRVFIQALERS